MIRKIGSVIHIEVKGEGSKNYESILRGTEEVLLYFKSMNEEARSVR